MTITWHIAIPAMDEAEYLPRTIAAVFSQKCEGTVKLYVCVNQPEEYRQSRPDICGNNERTLKWLENLCPPKPFQLEILDHSRPGKGWTGKNSGVGWARKTLFDHILQKADNQDFLISLDADTLIPENYLGDIMRQFQKNASLDAISMPYFHPLSGDSTLDRAILRYEIYMRNHFLNLAGIGCPYTFTAIGSAIAMRCGSLKRIGGITPVKSGEDFYLLQKFCKTGHIGNWNESTVYPAARYSSRVFFGTGPALIKGAEGDWDSYPIYTCSLYDDIAQLYQRMDELFRQDFESPFLRFLEEQFKSHDLWQPLRDNFKDLPHFRKAFHEKADALRILQYLKWKQKAGNINDAQALDDNLKRMFGTGFPYPDFESAPLDYLSSLRDFLFEEEQKIRKGLISKV